MCEMIKYGFETYVVDVCYMDQTGGDFYIRFIEHTRNINNIINTSNYKIPKIHSIYTQTSTIILRSKGGN